MQYKVDGTIYFIPERIFLVKNIYYPSKNKTIVNIKNNSYLELLILIDNDNREFGHFYYHEMSRIEWWSIEQYEKLKALL